MHDLYYWDEPTQAVKQYAEGDPLPVAVRLLAPVHDIDTWQEVREELAKAVARIEGAAGHYVLPYGTPHEEFRYGDPNENADRRLLIETCDHPDNIMVYITRRLAEMAQTYQRNFEQFNPFNAQPQPTL